MRLVVGLGNPGSEYDGTRHNLGFDAVALLAAEHRVGLRPHPLHRSGALRRRGREILLVQPTTYMNNSGDAVGALLGRIGAAPEEMLVCCDDLHLPLGTIRLRTRGGDGGHNGLRSIIAAVGGDGFPRLRCGIRGASAPGPGLPAAGYVLAPFEPDERSAAVEMIRRAADGILLAIDTGLDRAMNSVNGSTAP